jgi:hypothetical protein
VILERLAANDVPAASDPDDGGSGEPAGG